MNLLEPSLTPSTHWQWSSLLWFVISKFFNFRTFRLIKFFSLLAVSGYSEWRKNGLWDEVLICFYVIAFTDMAVAQQGNNQRKLQWTFSPNLFNLLDTAFSSLMSILIRIRFTIKKLTTFYHLGGFFESLDESGGEILTAFGKIFEYIQGWSALIINFCYFQVTVAVPLVIQQLEAKEATNYFSFHCISWSSNAFLHYQVQALTPHQAFWSNWWVLFKSLSQVSSQSNYRSCHRQVKNWQR